PLDEDLPTGSAVEALLALIAELEPERRLQALTHSSWTERRVSSWGRLAFLGDSVLGLTVAEHLYGRFPRSDIGRLTKIHGQVVSGRACAEIALELGVPAMLEGAYPDGFDGGLAPAELVASERAMASIVESLIGACYLQFGLDRTAEALLAAFAPQVDLASGTLLDFKSALQEQLARRGRRVRYHVVAESGPPHDKTFRVEARDGDAVLGSGAGSSKKAAEQAAAAEALEEASL
ncbi:MAG TPA: ribonuclease III domain-containing protein, partial [Solirubrobacterales bacterium]|nr:ribonuclease III domain-containing protein [Solirubrobacterales bacterium]